MTDAATQGSASPDAGAVAAAVVAGNAGAPSGANGADGADKGSGANGSADPFAGLETGTREWIGKKGYKSVGDIANAALSAESLIGKSVQLPDANAKPEDLDKFYGRLGRPEKPDGYQFKLPDGVPQDMPYDGEFANSFKPVAYNVGLRPEQAAAVHDFYVGEAARFYKGQAEAVATKMTTATADLEKTWGPQDSESFEVNGNKAIRALRGLGLEEVFIANGLLGPKNDRARPLSLTPESQRH